MNIPANLEPGSTFVQWNRADWCPVPGKPDTVALPKFLPGCFDHQIGTLIPFFYPCGAPLGQVMVENYRCADDGSGVWINFRVISLDGGPHEH